MKEFLKNLKFIWKYVKNEKKDINVFLISNILRIVSLIILPILSARIIIELTSNNYIQILLIAFAILIVDGLSSLFEYLNRVTSANIYRKALTALESDISKEVLKLDNKSLEDNGTGVFIQRLTNDTSRLSNVFRTVFGLFSELIRYIGTLIAIFLISKIVFIYAIIVLIVLYILEKISIDVYNKNDKVVRVSEEKATSLISEMIHGVKDIKMLNSEKSFMNELNVKIDDANYKRLKMDKTSHNYKLLMWEVEILFEFILIALLVILMSKNIIASSIALVLYNYAKNINWMVYVIDSFANTVKDFNLSCERVFEIIKNDKFKQEDFGNIHLDKIHGDFEFKNVTFGYDKRKVLKKLNFKVNANTTVAFVGKSGAGKSTIFNLLCKMYNVDSGQITIDGTDINDLDKDSIRGNITVISQDPYIFNMSIKDNLRLVKEDLTDKEMKNACKIACLDDFIKKLPDGYDTIVGEGGVNLSGGEKQRLAIARALIQKTEIILFDEATSALDNETQEKIQKAIENMKSEYTILIIAHRLSTIINADRILYLEDGKIKAEGTHKELLKTCEEYKKLYETELTKK